jgi:hypothetical protein
MEDSEEEWQGITDYSDAESPKTVDSAELWLAAPPELWFNTLEELEADLLRYARENYFGIRTGRSNKDRKGLVINKREYQCDRAEKPKHQETTKDTGSRGVACRFHVTARLYVTQGNRWKRTVENGWHNDHEPSLDPSAHPVHRRLTVDEKAQVAALSKTRAVSAKVIHIALKQANPNTLVRSRDIWNERARLRLKDLAGMTPTQALVAILQDKGEDSSWVFRFETDDSGHVTQLFFTHKKVIMLVRQFFEVFLIDATYKTNRYKMPLVHFMAVVPVSNRKRNRTGSNLSAAFCFLSGEKEPSYRWALLAFKELVLGDLVPNVFLRDGELAVRNALSAIFPGIS